MNQQLTLLTGVVSRLTTKVSSLELDQQTSSEEILQLRLILQSHHPSYSSNTSHIQHHHQQQQQRGIPHSSSYSNLNSQQYNNNPSNLVSPSTSYSDLLPSRRSSNPFDLESPLHNSLNSLPVPGSSSSLNSGLRYQFPSSSSSSSVGNGNQQIPGPFSIPNLPPPFPTSASVTSLRSLHPSNSGIISPHPTPTKQSSRDSLLFTQGEPLTIDQVQYPSSGLGLGGGGGGTYFDESSGTYISRRKSQRSSTSEGLRARGLSITPVIAQAKWLSQQQQVSSHFLERKRKKRLIGFVFIYFAL